MKKSLIQKVNHLNLEIIILFCIMLKYITRKNYCNLISLEKCFYPLD